MANPKDILDSIESKHFSASLDDVEALAKANMTGQAAVNRSANTYLRVLIAGVQAAVGMDSPRLAAARGKQASIDVDADIATLGTVHAQYYEAVMRAVVTDEIADVPGLRQAEKSRRALERNRRSIFARTAKSTVQSFIKAGGNVRTIVVPTATKAQLREFVADQSEATKLSPEQQAARFAAMVVRQLSALRQESAPAGDKAANQVLCDIAELASVWGGSKPTSSPSKAIAQHIPLKTQEGIFWPVPTIRAANADKMTVQ